MNFGVSQQENLCCIKFQTNSDKADKVLKSLFRADMSKLREDLRKGEEVNLTKIAILSIIESL